MVLTDGLLMTWVGQKPSRKTATTEQIQAFNEKQAQFSQQADYFYRGKAPNKQAGEAVCEVVYDPKPAPKTVNILCYRYGWSEDPETMTQQRKNIFHTIASLSALLVFVMGTKVPVSTLMAAARGSSIIVVTLSQAGFVDAKVMQLCLDLPSPKCKIPQINHCSLTHNLFYDIFMQIIMRIINPYKSRQQMANSHTPFINERTTELLAEILSLQYVVQHTTAADTGTLSALPLGTPFIATPNVKFVLTPDCLNKVKRHLVINYIKAGNHLPVHLTSVWDMVNSVQKVSIVVDCF